MARKKRKYSRQDPFDGVTRKGSQRKVKDPAVSYIIGKRGLPVMVAEACGLTANAVRQWAVVPPNHVMTVAVIIKWPLHRIRPDIFPKEISHRK